MVKTNTSEKALLAFTLAMLIASASVPIMGMKPAFARGLVARCYDGCAGEPCKIFVGPTGAYIDCCSGSNVVTAAQYQSDTYWSEDFGCVFDLAHKSGYCYSYGNFTDKHNADGTLIPCGRVLSEDPIDPPVHPVTADGSAGSRSGEDGNAPSGGAS